MFPSGPLSVKKVRYATLPGAIGDKGYICITNSGGGLARVSGVLKLFYLLMLLYGGYEQEKD